MTMKFAQAQSRELLNIYLPLRLFAMTNNKTRSLSYCLIHVYSFVNL